LPIIFNLKRNLIIGIVLASLSSLLWSGNYIIARGFHDQISPVSLAFFRWLTASICILPFSIAAIINQRQYWIKHISHLLIASITGVALFNTFTYIAGKSTTAINLALIGTTAAPVFVLLITISILKEKIRREQIVGTIICIIGIILLLTKGKPDELFKIKLSAGDMWMITAGLIFAIYTLLVKKKPTELSPLTYLGLLFFLGTAFLFPAYLVDTQVSQAFVWNAEIILVFIYLGIGASVLAFLFWNLSIARIGPARTTLFTTLIPVFSTIEAIWLLDEAYSWFVLISLLLVLTGLFIANLQIVKAMIVKN
jgi:drug/metabolite transporter (DMT)-like permease